jgi:RNA polymerase sigma-70 factor (ECF subfamily)
VLARKGLSKSRRDSIGSWLYGVAWRIAEKARIKNARRKMVEKKLHLLGTLDCSIDAAQADYGTELDQEVNMLPLKYRLPIVLCYFEGKSTAETAMEVGCPRHHSLSAGPRSGVPTQAFAKSRFHFLCH